MKEKEVPDLKYLICSDPLEHKVKVSNEMILTIIDQPHRR